MKLRFLELKDAPLMLEWMHDRNVTENLRADFASKTLQDAEAFIGASANDPENIHLAIASDTDEYMGTVSLKHIEDGTAEFAITVRSAAMGQGYAWYGMKSIIEKAFQEYGLNCVYWCVSRANTRAVRFYDKHKLHEAQGIPTAALKQYEEIDNLKWYAVYSADKY